jgi:hypothetical protein
VLAEGKATTFGEQVSRQFSKDAYKEGFRKTTKHAFDLLDRVGPKATAQTFFKDGLKPFAEGSPGMALNWGGLIVGGAAPPVVTGHDPSNLFGWKSVQHIGPEGMEFLKREQDAPDLQIKLQPVMSSPTHPGATLHSPGAPPPQGVMDD